MSGIVWITGLSGTGKSTLAERVAVLLRARGEPVVVLDGDALRAALGAAGAYDRGSRRRLAEQYARLAALLAAQGLTVVAAVIALFHEVQAMNRASGGRYLEVWLRAPEPIRARRARDAAAGGERVGHDIAPEMPLRADLVLDNDDRPETVARLAERVVAAWDAP